MALYTASLAPMFYDGLLRWTLGSLLLLAGATVAVLLVRQPARRIRVIQFALAGLVALPCLMLVPGYPKLAIVPDVSPIPSMGEGWGEGEAAAATLQSTLAPESVFDETEREGITASRSAEDREIATERRQPSAELDNHRTEPAPVFHPLPPGEGRGGGAVEALPESLQLASEPIIQSTTPSARTSHNYRSWIVIGYAVGVLGMAAWSLVGMWAVRRLLRAAEPAPAVCRILLRSIGGPASDRVALVTSKRAAQPCALFWRATTIVLPHRLAAGGDVQELRWALAHEWSHVQRGDLTTWTASGIVRWFYFHQPLVWWLRGQLQLCQDYIADAAAARTGEQPEDYAEFLTTSSFTQSALAAGLGIGGRISDLQRRVIMLVERRPPLECTSPRRWNLLALPLAALLIAATAGLAPQEKPREGAEEASEAKPVESSVPAVPALAPASPTSAPPAVAPVPTVPTVPAIAPAGASTPATPVATAPPDDPFAATQPEAAVAPVAAPRAPGEPADAPGGNAPAAPSGPRRIAPGDTLTIDVMDNLDSLGVLGLKLLLPPTTTVVVDADGRLPLGNAYGRIKVAGSTLDKAEGYLSQSLRNQIRGSVPKVDTTDERHKSFVDSLNHIEINVRLSYPAAATDDAIKRAVEWLKRSQVGDTSKPAASGPTVSPYLTLLDPRSQSQHERIEPGDVLNIEVDKPGAEVRPVSIVESDGNIPLGVRFGRVNVAGKTLSEAEKIIADCVAKFFDGPEVQVTYAVRSAGPGGESARINSLERQIERLNATISRLELEKQNKDSVKLPRPQP